MIIGQKYTFEWYDIADCTIRLSRDGRDNWTTIQANVITDLSEDVNPTGKCEYEWTITGPASADCYIKFIDNSDTSELIGDQFKIVSARYNKKIKVTDVTLCSGGGHIVFDLLVNDTTISKLSIEKTKMQLFTSEFDDNEIALILMYVEIKKASATTSTQMKTVLLNKEWEW